MNNVEQEVEPKSKKGTKKKGQISKHSTPLENDAKSCTWNEYLNTLSFQMEPANDGFMKRTAIELVTWARECTDAFMISQFFNMKGIPKRTFYYWIEKVEILKEAHEVAMGLLSDRREMLLIQKDPSSLRYVMPQYSEVWMNEDNRRATQKKEANGEFKTNLTVVIPPFPDTADDLKIKEISNE